MDPRTLASIETSLRSIATSLETIASAVRSPGDAIGNKAPDYTGALIAALNKIASNK